MLHAHDRRRSTNLNSDDGHGLRLAVVYVNSRAGIILKERVVEQLQARNVSEVLTQEVPDLLSLPTAAQDIITQQRPQVVIAVGVVANDVSPSRERREGSTAPPAVDTSSA